jgi:UPF0755 protein
MKWLIGIVAAVWLIAIVGGYAKDYYAAYQEEYTSTETQDGVDVVVEIPKNASAKEIASILKKNGLIRFEQAFVNRLQNSEYRGKLQSGTYTLNTGMNTLDMMKVMAPVVSADEPIDKLVVPEGFTIDQIAARCEEQGICTEQEFINAVKSVTTNDFPYLEDVPATADVRYKLEGYLFPATYDIYQDTTARSLVDWMLRTFQNYYTSELQEQAANMGYSSFEVITMASMVERECKVSEERAIVAGVVNNRLAAGMMLQVDPTVLYPLTDGMYNQTTVTYEDLELDSPYNTYMYTGLPVGPICNPGLECIKAVLYPESHDYLYYHIDNEELGTHIFTETYDEHINTMDDGGQSDSQDDQTVEE